MTLLLKESQLRRLIRRTLQESFLPNFFSREPQPQSVTPPTTDRTQQYQNYFHFSGLSCQDALLQYLHQNIQTLFDATHFHQNTVKPGSEYPERDKSHEGIIYEITRSIRLFFIQYLDIAPEDAKKGIELTLRNFDLLVGSFSGLLAKPFVSQIILAAPTASEQLAQKVYNAILQFPYFESTICPDFNRNCGQVLGQYNSSNASIAQAKKNYHP